MIHLTGTASGLRDFFSYLLKIRLRYGIIGVAGKTCTGNEQKYKKRDCYRAGIQIRGVQRSGKGGEVNSEYQQGTVRKGVFAA